MSHSGGKRRRSEGNSLQSSAMRRGNYGYDAPYALVIFWILAVGTGIGTAAAWWYKNIHAARPLTLYFLFFLANAISFLYTTRRGKFAEWERILDSLHFRGDEAVLDMGCGRGAVLTAVAREIDHGPCDWRRHLEQDRSIGKCSKSHPEQRVARRRERSRARRNRRHALSPISECILRSHRLQPRYPQHHFEC